MSVDTAPQPLYHIELDSFKDSSRSFSILAASRLCSECREKIESAESSAEDIIQAASECCSTKPEFTTPFLPILETSFRLFLANGNQPLPVDVLTRQMGECRQENFVPETDALCRMLDHDDFYGIRLIPSEPVDLLPEEEEEEQEGSEYTEENSSAAEV